MFHKIIYVLACCPASFIHFSKVDNMSSSVSTQTFLIKLLKKVDQGWMQYKTKVSLQIECQKDSTLTIKTSIFDETQGRELFCLGPEFAVMFHVSKAKAFIYCQKVRFCSLYCIPLQLKSG